MHAVCMSVPRPRDQRTDNIYYIYIYLYILFYIIYIYYIIYNMLYASEYAHPPWYPCYFNFPVGCIGWGTRRPATM